MIATYLALVLMTLLTLVSRASGTASDFNGTDSVVTITQQAEINLGTHTAGCWTRYETEGENDGGRLWSKASAWELRIFVGLLRFNAPGWTSQGQWDITAPAINTWFHVAVTYDASSTSNNPVMYLNGVSQAVTPISSPSGTFTAGTGDLYFGNASDGSRTWDGQLAECSLYNRVLGANEVKQIASRGPTSLPRGRIGYWPMGVFGARNYTATTGLTGTPTSVTVINNGPPIRYGPQGETP